MISGKSRTIYITLSFSFAFFFLINILSAQDSNLGTIDFSPKRLTQRQDTSDGWKKHTVQTTEPDTNFTWEKYASFLNKISDTSKYTVLPVNEFRQTFNSRKIIIGLRPVSYTHLRAHETVLDLVCRLLLAKKKN